VIVVLTIVIVIVIIDNSGRARIFSFSFGARRSVLTYFVSILLFEFGENYLLFVYRCPRTSSPEKKRSIWVNVII
jgi:hypothetical protein